MLIKHPLDNIGQELLEKAAAIHARFLDAVRVDEGDADTTFQPVAELEKLTVKKLRAQRWAKYEAIGAWRDG